MSFIESVLLKEFIKIPNDKHKDVLKDKKNMNNAIDGLLLKGIIQKTNLDKYSLTDYGEELNNDVWYRKTDMPNRKTVSNFIKMYCTDNHITKTSIVKRTGINSSRIGVLEGKISSKNPFLIDDLKAVFNALNLNYEKEIKRLKEFEKTRYEGYKDITLENTGVNEKAQKYKILVSESPIETLLLKEIIKISEVADLNIETQKEFKVGNNRYRGDIYISFNNQNSKNGVLIECDGHDYHERSKEQATKDKRRDRALIGLGILTMRFTGSEIWKSPSKCAKEIINTYEDYLKAIS